MDSTLLSVEGLVVDYGSVRAVCGVDFSISENETVALIGANGSGKSSIINTLIGRVRHQSGNIQLSGIPLSSLSPRKRAKLGIGYVPEGRRVFGGMTAEENLLVASRDGSAARKARVEDMYALFPQLGVRRDAPAWQLSGGEQQMLAIARALMSRPRLLLVDEPTLGLAPALAKIVIGALRRAAETGVGILLAEQSVSAALAACDRALVMRLGRIEVTGKPKALADDERLREIMMGG